MANIADGLNIVRKLVAAGLVPDLPIRRIVIDIAVDNAVVMYYETFADDRMLDLCIEELMKDGKIKAIPITEIPNDPNS